MTDVRGPVQLPTFPTPYIKDIQQLANHLKQRIKGLDRYGEFANTADIRHFDVFYALEVVALNSLKVVDDTDASRFGNLGFDVAMDCLFSDWWMREGECDVRTQWFDVFQRGLLLGLRLGRREDAYRLCSWVEPDLVDDVVVMDSSINAGVADVHKLISGFGTGRHDKFSDIKRTVERTTDRRTRFLYKMLQAAQSGNQEEFNAQLRNSVIEFQRSSKFDPRNSRIADRMAIPETSLILLGVEYGLALPDLDPDLNSYLLL